MTDNESFVSVEAFKRLGRNIGIGNVQQIESIEAIEDTIPFKKYLVRNPYSTVIDLEES